MDGDTNLGIQMKEKLVKKSWDGGSAFVCCEEKITKIHLLRIYFALEIFFDCILGGVKVLSKVDFLMKNTRFFNLNLIG
jgi:hypothetical protein